MIETVAQVIGFCGTAMTFLAYQQKKRRGILTCTIVSGSLFMLHYLLLGAYTGLFMNLLGVMRSFVFVNREKKWAKSLVWPAIFLVAFTVAGILTWDKWYSVLPLVAMLLTTVSNWFKNERSIRILTFPSSPCWLIYNVFTGSIAGVVTECFVMTSLVIAIIRYDILGRNKELKGDTISAN